MEILTNPFLFLLYVFGLVFALYAFYALGRM